MFIIYFLTVTLTFFFIIKNLYELILSSILKIRSKKFREAFKEETRHFESYKCKTYITNNIHKYTTNRIHFNRCKVSYWKNELFIFDTFRKIGFLKFYCTPIIISTSKKTNNQLSYIKKPIKINPKSYNNSLHIEIKPEENMGHAILTIRIENISETLTSSITESKIIQTPHNKELC